jgi:hypothetical protein
LNYIKNCHYKCRPLYVGSFGLTEIQIPSVYNGIVLEKSGDFVIFEGFGTYFKWDGEFSLTAKLDMELMGKTCGLCGNFDHDSANDLTTMEHTLTKSPSNFGNSWKMPDPSLVCEDSPSIHMCSAFTSAQLDNARGNYKIRKLICRKDKICISLVKVNFCEQGETSYRRKMFLKKIGYVENPA